MSEFDTNSWDSQWQNGCWADHSGWMAQAGQEAGVQTFAPPPPLHASPHQAGVHDIIEQAVKQEWADYIFSFVLGHASPHTVDLKAERTRWCMQHYNHIRDKVLAIVGEVPLPNLANKIDSAHAATPATPATSQILPPLSGLSQSWPMPQQAQTVQTSTYASYPTSCQSGAQQPLQPSQHAYEQAPHFAPATWRNPKPFVLRVSGWQMESAGPVDGDYVQSGSNHEWPMFWRRGSATRADQQTAIFYCDARHGAQFAGWWISPHPDSDKAWAFNPDANAELPPRSGWQTPPGSTHPSPSLHVEVLFEADRAGTSHSPQRHAGFVNNGTVLKSHPHERVRSRSPRTKTYTEPDDDSESGEEHQPPSRNNPSTMAKIIGSTKPCADANDPVYKMRRTDETPAWPVLINSKGKLIDVPYEGQTWGLNFMHPNNPNKKLHPEDFFRVMKFVSEELQLSMEKPTSTPDGTCQAKFGTKRGAGTLQFYLTQRSTIAGSCRIQIGQKEAERLKMIRSTLLCSAWFSETVDKTARIAEKTAEQAYKAEGKIMLPIITAATDARNVSKICKVVRQLVGAGAKKAIEEYFTRSGINREHPHRNIIDKEF
jgi:hypothetical protein